jgi:hypothetical protein
MAVQIICGLIETNNTTTPTIGIVPKPDSRETGKIQDIIHLA